MKSFTASSESTSRTVIPRHYDVIDFVYTLLGHFVDPKVQQ